MSTDDLRLPPFLWGLDWGLVMHQWNFMHYEQRLKKGIR